MEIVDEDMMGKEGHERKQTSSKTKLRKKN